MREAEGALIVGRVNTVNIDNVLKGFEHMSKAAKKAAEKAVEAGGDEAARQITASAERAKLRRTGKLIKSIRRGPVQTHYDSVEVDVYPRGNYPGKRKRVGEVAFVQYYGRKYGEKKREGVKFFDLAENQRKVVADRIEEVWREETGGENG